MLYAGRVSHVPLHFLKVYIPENQNSSVPEGRETSRSGVLVPPAFRDAIEMDPLPDELEESPSHEVKVENSDPSAAEPPGAPIQDRPSALGRGVC